MFTAVIAVVMAASGANSTGPCPRIVPRAEWGAREPVLRENMACPVDSVIIHHTYIPAACLSGAQCQASMRSMQNYHMDDRGWNDIGYSFAVGGDGLVYEGRGWQLVGAHAPRYNNHSIGIAFIGDYREQLPTAEMLSVVKSLIQCGVDNTYIKPDYQLLGHRQVRDTECPGEALYQHIQTWSHWRQHPCATSDTPNSISITSVNS